MAKKKETLTPEECLQAALVPESEQPYSVPGNWCWTKGRAFLKPMETKHPEGEVFRYIDIDAIDNKKQQVTEPKTLLVKDAPSRASRKLRTGDTIFSMVRPYLMNIAYIDETISNSIASTGFYVCTPAENVYPLYLYYLMTSPYTVEGLNRYMKGDNSPSIRKDDIENYPYPIPPLAEQQRIVDRIESLFAKLDEAKQKAQDALDSFETRKAAILHKAFTGELTAQWRKEHDVGMEQWGQICFDNSFIKMQNGLAKRSGSSGVPYSVLRLANLSDAGISTEDMRTILLDTKEQENYGLKKNDVLMIRVNGSKENVGKQFLLTTDNQWAFCDHIIRIKYKENLLPAYMVYFSKSDTYKLYVENHMVSSAGQNTISRKGMASLSIPVPDLREQTEIVRILDDLLAKEQQAKEAAEAVLEQIDLMKKSILARAFRGELGTNDPTEESAVELVKNII